MRKLSELLEGFIKKYVQCYSCGNPETTIRVKKEFITLKCKACGAVGRGPGRGWGGGQGWAGLGWGGVEAWALGGWSEGPLHRGWGDC
jgi:hypothetical protein